MTQAGEAEKLLEELLNEAIEQRASDIHLREGLAPAFRKNNDLIPLNRPATERLQLVEIFKVLAAQHNDPPAIETLQDFDCAYGFQERARVRCNVFRHKGRLGIVMRLINQIIPTVEDLGLAQVLKSIAESDRGLILVTGATGSGKSTTLATMVNHLNSTQNLHILTIEDPIEFLHPQKKASITQRESGSDTQSFGSGLRSALRQDPDVIMVGEMRDLETVDVALKAAETGHAVFSTVHTTDVRRTIGRLVSLFPPSEQKMARLRLADNLKAVISQRLLDRADGNGRVAAQEIMISTVAIQECILDPEKTGGINEFIEQSSDVLGTQTFEQHLLKLYLSGVITLETAKSAAASASDFENRLLYSRGGKEGQSSDVPKVSLDRADSFDPVREIETSSGRPTGEATDPASNAKKEGADFLARLRSKTKKIRDTI